MGAFVVPPIRCFIAAANALTATILLFAADNCSAGVGPDTLSLTPPRTAMPMVLPDLGAISDISVAATRIGEVRTGTVGATGDVTTAAGAGMVADGNFIGAL